MGWSFCLQIQHLVLCYNILWGKPQRHPMSFCLHSSTFSLCRKQQWKAVFHSTVHTLLLTNSLGLLRLSVFSSIVYFDWVHERLSYSDWCGEAKPFVVTADLGCCYRPWTPGALRLKVLVTFELAFSDGLQAGSGPGVIFCQICSLQVKSGDYIWRWMCYESLGWYCAHDY